MICTYKPKTYIFVGYDHGEFGYRCYDQIARKLIHNRDVIFVKDQTIEDISKVEKSNLIDNHIIDLDSDPMIREVTQSYIAQEDLDIEQVIVNNEVDVNHDVIIPEIDLEQRSICL
jgi:hypothetical protein